MTFVILLSIIFLTCLSIWRIQYGVALLFAIPMLLSVKFSIPIGGLNLNTLNFSIIAFSAVCYYKRTRYSLSRGFQQRILLIALAICIIGAIGGLLNIGFVSLIKNEILYCIEFFVLAYMLPFVRFEDKHIRFFDIVLCCVSTIVILYALFNYVFGVNPYSTFVAITTNTIDADFTFINEQRGVLSSRVSSTFPHPIQLGQVMACVLCYFLFKLKEKVNTVVYVLCIGFFTLPILFSGARSALIPIFVVFVYLFVKSRKLILGFCLAPLALLVVYSAMPEKYQKTFDAMVFFWDKKASEEVKGSSMEMRITQLYNAINVTGSDIIWGKGIGYINEKGSSHPEMLGYEGFFLRGIVENGIIGTLLWMYFLYYLYSYGMRHSYSREGRRWISIYCIVFFLNIMLTGIMYGSFLFFIVLYFMILNNNRTLYLSKYNEQLR